MTLEILACSLAVLAIFGLIVWAFDQPRARREAERELYREENDTWK